MVLHPTSMTSRRRGPARAGGAGLLVCLLAGWPAAGENGTPGFGGPDKGPTILSPRGPALMMPAMSAANGRRLFASKGCVVCHSVNRIGGDAAPGLDSSPMPVMVNPFDFAARMLRGAPAMTALQQKDLGYRIELTGQELADITAFAHDRAEQKRFSPADIPPAIERLMHSQRL